MTARAYDTSPEADAVLRRAVMARPPAERLRLATSLWATGKRLVEAGLRAEGVTDPVELKVRTFLRIYAADFDQATLSRIADRLRATG
jgi:hypothetical protein